MLKIAIVRAVQEEAADNPSWPDTKSLLENGNIAPFVSNFVCHDIFGADVAAIAAAWAEDIKSPFSDRDNCDLARVAQFYSVQTSNREAKRHYLDSLKNYLLGAAKQEGGEPDLINKLMTTYKQQTFSEVAYRLGYPKCEDEQQNPLRLLAELPLPLYLTTSYHDFLEVALSKNSRQAKPVSEIYYWRSGLEHIHSIFDNEPDFEPTLDRPLVYHLYGLDTYPESLVFTEDDYLDFLVNTTLTASEVYYSDHPERQKGFQRRLPSCVLRALGKALLMLGYSVYDWEFKVLFKGLIQPKSDSRLSESISMQHSPSVDDDLVDSIAIPSPMPKNEPGETDLTKKRKEQIEGYLVEYFKQAKFKVFWGNPQECMQRLWRQWEG